MREKYSCTLHWMICSGEIFVHISLDDMFGRNIRAHFFIWMICASGEIFVHVSLDDMFGRNIRAHFIG